MRTLRFAILLALGLSAAACSGSYDTNGPCSQDSDCELCTVCGCPQPYAFADVVGATCDTIAKSVSCPSTKPDSCLQGPRQAVCASGHCQAVAK
ncbi:MAG: hypothetical protein JST54_18475 [Deltaproteobacteria bacterium]|nr:hypothetical protein [Deltaproteobacteria bacterium]